MAAPALMARLAWPKIWLRAWTVMLATMIVDTDHLLADPVFDPNRCSIGFHPLHSTPAIAAYAVAFFFLPRLRLAAMGLLLHMFLDLTDCWWMRLEGIVETP